MTRRSGYVLSATLAVSVALFAANGCSSDAVGVDTCRRIEEARCRTAPSCGIPLTPPYTREGQEIEGCVRYYRDACLHGLPNSKEPSRTEIDLCLTAINSSCAAVAKPEAEPACSFLVVVPPPPAVVDASVAD